MINRWYSWADNPGLIVVAKGLSSWKAAWEWWPPNKNAYKLHNVQALKSSPLYKIYMFECMDRMFYAEFQRVTLKYHTEYIAHALKDMV